MEAFKTIIDLLLTVLGKVVEFVILYQKFWILYITVAMVVLLLLTTDLLATILCFLGIRKKIHPDEPEEGKPDPNKTES